MNIRVIAKASTLSQQLAKLQSDLRGVVKSGPPIRWDSRVDTHEDFLATSEQHARNVLNGDV